MQLSKAYNVVNNNININLNMDSQSALKSKTDYPVLNMLGEENSNFNSFYRGKAIDQQHYVISQIAKPAMEDNAANTHTANEWIAKYNITYNNKPVISIFSDQYQYTGGAHGITIRTSQTWNIPEDRQMELWEFFPNDSDYEQKLKEEIIRQIEERMESAPDSYFENYKELVEQNFKSQNYYLIQEPLLLVLYFEQYEIAPYSSGITEFQINFR